jgi:LacI family transcriptional regulator
MKPATGRVSVRSIARLAEVSPMAVSFALQNRPGVSSATRERILRIAKELGYAPDARIGHWMARVRDAKSKDLLPIAWLNTTAEEDAWRHHLYFTPYFEGACARALELGYKIEDIWAAAPGMTMRRLAKIIYERGIEGAVITFPARHFRLDWDHLASVALGAALLAPRLHQVTADLNFNLLLALKSLRKLGYRRIGICLAREVDSASHYTLRSTARDLYHSVSSAQRIPPLFHAHYQRTDREAEMVVWLKRYRPEVIVGHNSFIKQWVEAAGYRVPEDVGLVHLALDDDVPDWAGIHSKRRETGATAIDQLVASICNHHYGVPKTPLNILIRGSWRNGSTLRTMPKHHLTGVKSSPPGRPVSRAAG